MCLLVLTLCFSRHFVPPFSFPSKFGFTLRWFDHVRMASPASSQPKAVAQATEINEVSEVLPPNEDDSLEFDVEELKEQLGIDRILDKLNSLAEKCSERTEYPGSGARNTKSISEAAEEGFDPTAPFVVPEDCSAQDSKDEEFMLPSVFEEIESFGPDVADIIAQRINDACSKKAMDSKLKELYEKYKTPGNCKLLCVPKVNMELWHDLSKESKNKDLGLQEVQMGIVKAAQPIIQLFDMALKARKDKSTMDSGALLPILADAVTFIGHASFLTSLKRRDLLRPDIAKPYQSVCSKSNPITTCLFGDELPKHIKDIGEVNKISKRVSGRPGLIKHTVNTYKSGADNRHYQQRSGRRTTFLGYRGRGEYFHNRQHVPMRSTMSSSTNAQKDKA